MEQAIKQARETYGPQLPSKGCGAPNPSGDIVVCATDSKEFRVQSSAELDPKSREALRDGVPRAPQLDRGSCKGEANCFGFGKVPPPVYYFDIAALPEAPPGSEADRIAKGELAEP